MRADVTRLTTSGARLGNTCAEGLIGAVTNPWRNGGERDPGLDHSGRLEVGVDRDCSLDVTPRVHVKAKSRQRAGRHVVDFFAKAASERGELRVVPEEHQRIDLRACFANDLHKRSHVTRVDPVVDDDPVFVLYKLVRNDAGSGQRPTRRTADHQVNVQLVVMQPLAKLLGIVFALFVQRTISICHHRSGGHGLGVADQVEALHSVGCWGRSVGPDIVFLDADAPLRKFSRQIVVQILRGAGHKDRARLLYFIPQIRSVQAVTYRRTQLFTNPQGRVRRRE